MQIIKQIVIQCINESMLCQVVSYCVINVLFEALLL
ncbi:MAG: hypothetical protein ACI8QG_001576, partial [Flavobacteriales bacterium]